MIDQIVTEHMLLVKFIAQKIAARLPASIELDDLVSCGVIGLMDAVRRYDPNRPNKFKTYAEFRIRGEILDELRRQDMVPRSVRDKNKELVRITEELTKELGREPQHEELAEKLEMSMDQFFDFESEALLSDRSRLLSIEGHTEFSRADKANLEDLANEAFVDPLKCMERQRLNELMDLDPNPRRRLIVRAYFFEDLKLKQIGARLGMTESRASQLLNSGIFWLRNELLKRENQIPPALLARRFELQNLDFVEPAPKEQPNFAANVIPLGNRQRRCRKRKSKLVKLGLDLMDLADAA